MSAQKRPPSSSATPPELAPAAPGRAGLGRLYAQMWRHAGTDRPRVVLFMTMLIAAAAVGQVIPYLTGKAADAIQAKGGPDLAAGAWDMALIFIAALVNWALHGPARALERFVAMGVRRRFSDALFRRITGLGLAWHEAHHSGDVIQRAQRAAAALFQFSQFQFVYLQSAVRLIVPLAAMLAISLTTGLAAVAGYVLVAVVLVRFDRLMVPLNREEIRAEARYAAALVDCLGNISTVLTLRLQEAARRLVDARLLEVFAPLRRGVVVNEAKWAAVDLLNNALRSGLVVLYVWDGWRRGDPLMLGGAVMIFQYANAVGGVVGNMASHYQDLVRYQTDFSGVDVVLEAAGAPAGGAALPPDWREIAVEELDFAYPSRVSKAAETGRLSGVSLALARGRRIALVGGSGSGKSTLLRVLAGLYLADRARISVDGRPQPEMRHLGAAATLVPQDPELFEASIRENITLGAGHSSHALKQALEIACFAEVAAALPAGLDSGVAERGVNLSGGENQRLALARGVLAARDSSLLLLDEPTSSLDPETEARVYDNLFAAFPRACIVSSIHRLHLLPRFDLIVLMDDGRTIDAGSLADLLRRQPLFRSLWKRFQDAENERLTPPLAAISGGD
jgi:ATP-binding cassette subfamily B protein